MGWLRGFHRTPLLPRARRWRLGRLGAALGASLAVHGAVVVLAVGRWSAGPDSATGLVVTLVEPVPPPVATPPVLLTGVADAARDPAEPARLARELEAAAGASAAVAAEVIEQGRQIGREVEHRREIAALEIRNARLEQALAARNAREAEARAAYEQLVDALRREIADKDVALEQANERLTVAIGDRVLFPSGQATLTPEGERVIDKVGTALAAVSDRRVLIEGHTDDVPIGPDLSHRFPSNWELSTARATEVVRRLVGHARVPPGRLSAVGRADTEPAASNETEDGRRRNRRIEIILLPPASSVGSDTPAS